MHTLTKKYRDLPAAHRQPKHQGHCRFIHGHNWGFDITFTCDTLNECDFVIDCGGLQCIKQFLQDTFDHTLLLNKDDDDILKNDDFIMWLRSITKMVLVPSCGMEGLAEYVFKGVASMIGDSQDMLYDRDPRTGAKRGLKVVSVTCWEDTKNSATYRP
jgi:6-pyruvoyltetrahydropterin/6-carboxytetrahydropterin synthase